MSLEENKAITLRVVEEIWNQKRLELIEETFAQHLNNHGLVMLNGPEVIERIFSRWLTAFPGRFLTRFLFPHSKRSIEVQPCSI